MISIRTIVAVQAISFLRGSYFCFRLPVPPQRKHVRDRVFGVQNSRDGRFEERAVQRQEARRCGEYSLF